MTIRRFSYESLKTLSRKAQRSQRYRKHLNIHTSHKESCQRLLNAIGVGSYIHPHRHLLDPKVESLIAVRGLFALVTFDDVGTVQEIIRFGTEKYSTNEDIDVGVELSPMDWHTVIALVPNSVLFELKPGPFNQDVAKELASWAPDEKDSEEVQHYLEKLYYLSKNQFKK